MPLWRTPGPPEPKTAAPIAARCLSLRRAPKIPSAIASIKGVSADTPLQLTLLRKPVRTLLRMECEMQLGAPTARAWKAVALELTSLRELKYDCPAASGVVAMRDADEVAITDHPGGS